MSHGGKTILHADDVARWRNHVKQLLSSIAQVVSVEDCDAVLPRLGEGDIDLLVLDVLMPASSGEDTGYDICHLVKKDYPDLPVVIYTGAWQDVKADRDELEVKFGAPVVFKERLEPGKDDLVAQVSALLV